MVSLNRFKVGDAAQLSIAAGRSAIAAAIPAALLHSTVRSSAPETVVTTGAVESRTWMVCV